MTMLAKQWAIGLAAVAFLALASPAQASDTIKLKLPGQPSSDTLDLKATDDDLSDEFLDARYYRGGGFRGGYGGGFYRGGYGGYRGGISYGYRGGYYGGIGYRGGYSGGGYYGGYARFGYGGCGYYGYSYPSYYSGYSCYSPGCYTYDYISPCSSVTVLPPVTVRVGPSYSLRPAPSTVLPGTPGPAPVLPLPKEDSTAPGTFNYDGGPKELVPMPKGEDGAMTLPRKPAVAVERVVSLTQSNAKSSNKWSYPAYGESATRNTAKKADPKFQLIVYGRPAR
jgi:hypothetical protein